MKATETDLKPESSAGFTPTHGSAISSEQIRNGTVWLADAPWCWTMIVQWMDKDQYLLLVEPMPAVHGGTCMVFHGDKDGKIIRSQEETRDFLNRVRSKQINARLLLQNS